MFRPLTSPATRLDRTASPARRGTILIVVLALLALFAVIALFFVFYADAEATGSRINREAENNPYGNSTPNDLAIAAFNETLASLIFDKDDVNGMLSGLRGISLARTMYGWNGTPGPGAPFSGIGTFHDTNAPTGIDRAQWVNHSAPFTPSTGPMAGATFWKDPEWTGYRKTAQLGMLPSAIPGNTYVPMHAPYTYPDLKDFVLASLSPATGEVLVPSLYRPWLFNPNTGPGSKLAPWNPNNPVFAANTDWVTAEGRTKILRPRPIDQLQSSELISAIGIGSPPTQQQFASLSAGQKNNLFGLITTYIAQGQIIPYPQMNADGTFTADVQNLLGGVGVQKNDSILIDIGLPPKLWNGKWIKPLAAVLVSDLDGLLNLNVHGNLRAMGSHGSYAGYGPNEVNLSTLLGGADAGSIVLARNGIAAWATGTNYSAGAMVFNAGNFYQATTAGTSGPAPGPTSSGAGITDGSVKWTSSITIGIPRNGLGSLAYDRSGNRIPAYSQVNFDAGGNTSTSAAGIPLIQLPQFAPTTPPPGFTPNPFQTVPMFNTTTQTFFDDNVTDGPPSDTYSKYQNHPLLWNPNDYPAGVAGKRTYPLADLRRFNNRYAADPDYYHQTFLFNSFKPSMLASLMPSTGPGPSYRLDPSHPLRGLTTTLSTSLDLPGLVGNFNTSGGAPQFQFMGGAHPTNTVPGSFQGGAGADFNGPNDFRNPKSALGPIDLNRPLMDYRTNTSLPLGTDTTMGDTTNSGNYLQAWVDRHNLARDILGRLIVATGANATVFTQATTVGMTTFQAGDIQINATVGNNDYNAIRYLAQIAVNMVDAIDTDDISTPFVWNPGPSWTTPNTITRVDTTTLPTMVTTGSPPIFSPTGLMFGVEKTRLVINEAYGEITNNPTETLGAMMPAAMSARVRFWVELMNPTSTPYSGTGTTTSPLGTGAVTLHNGTFNPYQLQITQITVANQNSMTDTTNSTGSIPTPGVNTGFTFDFSTATAAQRTIQPVNGVYAPANGSPGIALISAAPFATPHTVGSPVEFNPTVNAPFNAPGYSNQIILGNPAPGGTNAMEYNYGSMPAAANLETAAFMNPLRRHLVLLRRLANPYQQPDPIMNPYITVDTMDYVPAFDAVVRGGAAGDKMDRTPKAAAGITNPGFEQIDGTSGGSRRFSVGKVQPYAGFATSMASGVPGDVNIIANFPASMVVAQNPNGAALPPAGNPLNTFFRMNGRNLTAPTTLTYNAGPPANLTVGGFTETIMAPFDWYIHYDRPLVNQLELMSVLAAMPHFVTQYSLQPPIGAGPLRRGISNVPWLGVFPTGTPPPNQAGYPPMSANGLPIFDTSATNPNSLTNNGLYRALETLRVKPWMYGAALGGKVHGKININTMQDPRILQALIDAQSGNFFNIADVSGIWSGAINSTTPVAGFRTIQSIAKQTASGASLTLPLPGPTNDDVPNPTAAVNGISPPFDRPFRSLGAPEYSPGSTLAAIGGSGIQDTLLRINPSTGQPLLWSTNVSPSLNGLPQPYYQAEMARKMLNNTTTTSNAFAVNVTIVFHEVRMSGTAPLPPVNETGLPNAQRYLIGKEAFQYAPGDLRQQFFAVVDRSNLVLNSTGTLQAGFNWQLGQTALNGSQTPFNLAMNNLTLAPTSAPAGYINPSVPNSWNLYLDNVDRQAIGQPYSKTGNPFTLTFFADGKQITMPNTTNPSFPPFPTISVGVGANQETLTINYVNEDGSLNVSRSNASLNHSAGDLVSNYLPGNPGPISPMFPANPPFDVLTNPNSPYSGVVPYAKRVR